MLKTFKALKALTSDQRRILDTKFIDGEYEAQALVAELRAVAEFDRMSDGVRKGLVIRIVVCALVAFATIFMVANGITWALVLMGAAVALAIYFGVMLSKLKALDLSNNFRVVAMPLLAILSEDMASDARLHVRLDLTAPDVAAKKISTSEPYKHGVYYKVIDTTYKDAWFDGSAKLADGSLLRWSVVEHLLESKRSKRNARGKYKTKTRQYKRSVIEVDVALPKDTYALGPMQAPPDHKLSIKPGEKRRVVKLDRKIKQRTHDPIDARELIDLIAMAYGAAKPATTGAAA